MKCYLFAVSFSLCSLSAVRSESLDQLITRFLAGEVITAEDRANVTDVHGPASEAGGVDNNGSAFLQQMKRSIIGPDGEGGWYRRSTLIFEARAQQKTYRELKAIYEKNKTPLIAYALVCPAMYVDDMELLPELFAKIAENRPLKAHFDKVYASYWKPRLDPDF